MYIHSRCDVSYHSLSTYPLLYWLNVRDVTVCSRVSDDVTSAVSPLCLQIFRSEFAES